MVACRVRLGGRMEGWWFVSGSVSDEVKRLSLDLLSHSWWRWLLPRGSSQPANLYCVDHD